MGTLPLFGVFYENLKNDSSAKNNSIIYMVDTASTRQDTKSPDQAKMGWERDKRPETTDKTQQP